MSISLEVILPLQGARSGLLRSVASLAAQTDRDFGVMLVANAQDRGQLDEAERILTAARVAVKRAKTSTELGPVEHWNWAHGESQADWLKPLRPGEELAPEYVARIKQRIREKPGAGMIRCDAAVATDWGRETERAPFGETSLQPAQFVEMFPGRLEWLGRSINVAYSRAAWRAVGGCSPHLATCAALHLNVLMALHHGVENVAEPLAIVNSTDAASLNVAGANRVRLCTELWLIFRQARNYCLSSRLPWSKKWLLPRAWVAAWRCG